MNNEDFELYLRQGNMTENTINAYLYAIKEYYSRHRELNKRNLLIYKTYLIETFKPKTVNLRIQAMNKYLECIKKPRLRLKSIKVQQRSYLENVISNADYIFLKNKLKKEDNLTWYFVVRFFAATGARVSELIQIKIEHVQIGYYDIYTKGGKIRRIYIPKTLRKEAAEWLIKNNRTSGYLFLNRFGERITTRGIAQQLKNYAVKYGLSFSDAHELKQAKDTSLNCSIKRSLAERLDASKTFILIVGDHTKELKAGGCQYCGSYNSYRGTCSRGHTIDTRSYIDFECEKAIQDGLKIIVLYKSTFVNRDKCPEVIRWKGIHVPMEKWIGNTLYWDYDSVRNAIGQ